MYLGVAISWLTILGARRKHGSNKRTTKVIEEAEVAGLSAQDLGCRKTEYNSYKTMGYIEYMCNFFAGLHFK